ncbi:MAG: DeoR/GlpR family DNA-binding transcription regulator, partial [Trichococcus flocculiformis]
MLTDERHKIILDTLAKDNIVKLQDLVDQTGSSESTIRRDLSTLEEAGFLIRIHGGAKRSYNVSAEDRMEDKTSKNVRDKQRIAEKAAQLVSDQDIIFLDAGSTTYEMIP